MLRSRVPVFVVLAVLAAGFALCPTPQSPADDKPAPKNPADEKKTADSTTPLAMDLTPREVTLTVGAVKITTTLLYSRSGASSSPFPSG